MVLGVLLEESEADGEDEEPLELDGLELEEPLTPAELELDPVEPVELEALPELPMPAAAHSARLIMPSLFLSRDSKVGVLLLATPPLALGLVVELDAEPVAEPVEPDEESDTLGVLGEVALGELVLGELDEDEDDCANALPTARLATDRAINACLSNFMVSPGKGSRHAAPSHNACPLHAFAQLTAGCAITVALA